MLKNLEERMQKQHRTTKELSQGRARSLFVLRCGIMLRQSHQYRLQLRWNPRSRRMERALGEKAQLTGRLSLDNGHRETSLAQAIETPARRLKKRQANHST